MHDLRSALASDDLTRDQRGPVEPRITPGKVTLTSRLVQRKGSAPVVDLEQALALIDRARAGGGAALPAGLQLQFGRSLGAPLDGVRVHTGPAASEAASALGARAFTVGQDVVFGEGQYDAGSSDGLHLIAHEVAHTVQQAGVASPAHAMKELEVSSPGDALEREADAAADAMVRGQEATVSPGSGVARQVIQREPDPAAGTAKDHHKQVVGPRSGTVSADPYDPGELAGGCDLHGPGCHGGHDVRIVTAIDYTPVVTRAMPGGAIGHDSIAAGGITLGSKVGRGGGIPGSAFGKATPKFKSENLSWKIDGDVVTITGKIFVDVLWDVQSRGRIGLETGEDSVLGPGNYIQAITDLTPQGAEAPPRDVFWVQSVTEAHEQVHVREYIANAATATSERAAELSAQKIKLPKSDSEKSVEDQLAPLLRNLPRDVGNDVLEKFKSGGESRAYGATNGGYTPIVDKIKAKAAKLGWDKQAKQAGPKGGYVPPEARPGHRPEDDEGDGGG